MKLCNMISGLVISFCTDDKHIYVPNVFFSKNV